MVDVTAKRTFLGEIGSTVATARRGAVIDVTDVQAREYRNAGLIEGEPDIVVASAPTIGEQSALPPVPGRAERKRLRG